jgi:hypothetical protein
LNQNIFLDDFAYQKKKKDGSFSVISSPFINFHLSKHWFEDFEELGASQYFSTEPFEHKIKQLKMVAKLTNSKNPCQDTPLADYYKISEKWKQETILPDYKPSAFWKTTRIRDPLCPFLAKLYAWNTIQLQSGLRLQREDFVELQNKIIIQILDIWGPTVVTSMNEMLIKVLTFKDPSPVPHFPLWSLHKINQIELINPSLIERRVLGVVTADPSVYLFDNDFKI